MSSLAFVPLGLRRQLNVKLLRLVKSTATLVKATKQLKQDAGSGLELARQLKLKPVRKAALGFWGPDSVCVGIWRLALGRSPQRSLVNGARASLQLLVRVERPDRTLVACARIAKMNRCRLFVYSRCADCKQTSLLRKSTSVELLWPLGLELRNCNFEWTRVRDSFVPVSKRVERMLEPNCG